MFRKLIRDEISKIVPTGTNFSVEVPEVPEHGDYSSNAAMVLGKKEGKNPGEVANELKNKLLSNLVAKWVEKIEIAGPGFLNFFISPKALISLLRNPTPKRSFFEKFFSKKKTVIVEYFQLNIAKRPHVGHMRSAIIGDSLKRMFLQAGYNVISDTHVGDWGTQFGILLLSLKEPGVKIDESNPFNDLENLYISQNKKIEEKPELRDQAKEEFAKLERGDLENRKLWKWMVDISMKNLEQSAKLLELLPFDEHKGESSYEKDMPGIVSNALAKKVAVKKEDGSMIVDLTNEKLDEAVLIKSDGASTYLLRDLATIKYRKNKYNFNKNLYVVDVRQEHHFRQVFSVAEKLGYDGVDESKHVSYGFLKLPDGAMSTRAGNIISIDEMINEAKNRALKIIEEKNPELKDKEKIAYKVGLGAIKYFDLSHNRKSDIEFRWEDVLSFEGDTGPYIQYTYARLRSILRKYGKSTTWRSDRQAEMDAVEKKIILAISMFDEVLEDALADYMPNILANFIFNLAQKANEFYHSHPVLQEADQSKKEFRLALISKISETLKKGLYLLGIDALEEM